MNAMPRGGEQRVCNLAGHMASGSLQDEADFAEEEFLFGLHTVLDGIEARVTGLTSARRRH
jgi:hypothetical protein